MWLSVNRLNEVECWNLINIRPLKKPKINLPNELIECIFNFLRGDDDRIQLLSLAPIQFRRVCFEKRFSWTSSLNEIAKNLISQNLKWKLEEIFNPHSENETTFAFWCHLPIKLTPKQIKLILSGEINLCLKELISQTGEIRNLNLECCTIKHLPNLKHFKNLICLNIPSSDLKAIPESIHFLQNLESFNASFNDLTAVSPSIGKLKALRTLNLRNNKIIQLPDEICNLKQLKVLYIHQNLLKKLPQDIGFCNLEEFCFSSYFSSIEILPDSMRRLIHLNCKFDESVSSILEKIQNPRAKIEYLFTPTGHNKQGLRPITDYVISSLIVACAVSALFFR